MEKMVFGTGWESFFESHQLCAFDDFFNYAQGQTINQNAKRNVIVLELDDNGRKRIFYMKRFFQPHVEQQPLLTFISWVDYQNSRIDVHELLDGFDRLV